MWRIGLDCPFLNTPCVLGLSTFTSELSSISSSLQFVFRYYVFIYSFSLHSVYALYSILLIVIIFTNNYFKYLCFPVCTYFAFSRVKLIQTIFDLLFFSLCLIHSIPRLNQPHQNFKPLIFCDVLYFYFVRFQVTMATSMEMTDS